MTFPVAVSMPTRVSRSQETSGTTSKLTPETLGVYGPATGESAAGSLPGTSKLIILVTLTGLPDINRV